MTTTSTPFVVGWVIAFVAFCAVPILFQLFDQLTVCSGRMLRRLCCCYQIAESDENDNQQPSSNSEDSKPMKLTRLEESNIREAYLIESISIYSKNLEKTDFVDRSTSSSFEHNEVQIPFAAGCEERDGGSKISMNKIESFPQQCDVEKTKEEPVDTILIEVSNIAEVKQPEQPTTSSSNGSETNKHDNPCTDDTSVDESAVDFFGDSDDDNILLLRLPSPGEPLRKFCGDIEQCMSTLRCTPAGCSVCLCAYKPGDRVTWSSNKLCNHTFHESCIFDWLRASGRRNLRRMRQRKEMQNVDSPRRMVDIIQEIKNVPWLCPVCRQDFIHQDNLNKRSINESPLEVASGITGSNDEYISTAVFDRHPDSQSSPSENV